MSTAVVVKLDLKGLSCPLPIIKTAKAMKTMGAGELLEVFATDPGSVPDFKAWAQTTGNELITCDEQEGVFHFVLKKKEA